MFGIGQKRVKAGPRLHKIHSIAAAMRDRSFEGSFNVAGVPYSFTYIPRQGVVTSRKFQLIGSLLVIDGRPHARVPPHSVDNVRATLSASQGGIGLAPPRDKLPTDIVTGNPSLPSVESTGSLSFCGVLYFKLSPLAGRSLGVAADFSDLQMNVRLIPVSEKGRSLQAVYSSIVDSLFGRRANPREAAAFANTLNKILLA